MLCVKPADTNAEIGITMATALSLTLQPAMAMHTARQTSTSQRIPLKNAAQNGKLIFDSGNLHGGPRYGDVNHTEMGRS